MTELSPVNKAAPVTALPDAETVTEQRTVDGGDLLWALKGGGGAVGRGTGRSQVCADVTRT